MKKKILSLVLAVASVVNVTAFAAKYEADVQTEDTKAIVMCYDENGKLAYSKLFKADEEKFNIELPEKCDGMKKKVYFVDTKRFGELKAIEETVAPTEEPVSTTAPTDAPQATAEPTKEPVQATIYEKQIDSIFAPAVVKDVDLRSGNDGTDVYGITVLYQGEEITVAVEDDLTIATAPSQYADLVGEKMNVLQAGDVIVFEANVAGDRIKNVDFILRPTEEDIVTGDVDYGTSFEKLFVSGGKVAGKWTAMKYGQSASNDRYQYAFGIIGKKDDNTFTLINMTGSEDSAIELTTEPDTIVYVCDVSEKELTPEIGDVSDIQTTISKKAFYDTGVADLSEDNSYNYALVRVVDGIATDVVVYSNYN